MNREEKENILDQHKHLYDGYVTKYNQESNQYPLYVQDLANDKNGISLKNDGTIGNYTNFRINEQPLDRIADGPMDLKNGTVDIDSYQDTEDRNTQFMHDVYPSPNENEEEYVSYGNMADELENNKKQYEYDIDELEDYSVDDMSSELEESDEDEDVDDLEMFSSVDEDILPDFISELNESLDMFKRFKKYN
jgi:hypothetical protein